MIDQIIKEVTTIVINKGHENINLSTDADLRTDCAIDSLDLLEILSEVETKFSVDNLDDDIEGVKTIRDIAVKVEARLGHKN